MAEIHIHVHDAFEESKHPRAENGQFGSGGGKVQPKKAGGSSGGKEAAPKRKEHKYKRVWVSMTGPDTEAVFGMTESGETRKIKGGFAAGKYDRGANKFASEVKKKHGIKDE